MTASSPPGRRRSDRVLAPNYLAGIDSWELAEVRRLRREAVEEEADLSYVRRLLQGRVDIVRAELQRRAGGAPGSILPDLARILAGPAHPRPGHPRPARHPGPQVGPPHVGDHRREVEYVLADVDLSDVTARTDEELRVAVARLVEYEAQVSAQRHRVQEVVDACNAEIARRYRDGEAQVAELLARLDDRPASP